MINKITGKKLPGFSFIELIVSISVLVLISSLFLANYSGGRNKARLDGATHSIVSALRLVQGFALAAKNNNGSIPPGGWCIYLTAPQNYIRMFSDNNSTPNHRFDSGEKYGEDIYVDQSGLNLEIRGTESGAQNYYELFQGSTLIAAKKNLHICYEPPLPTIYITGTGPGTGGGGSVYSGSSTIIQLYDIATKRYKNVFINDFGLIDVQ